MNKRLIAKELVKIARELMADPNFKKVQDHQKPGEYKPTSVDVRKNSVDFLVIQTDPFVIRWVHTNKTQQVTKQELTKLQQKYTWSTDF